MSRNAVVLVLCIAVADGRVGGQTIGYVKIVDTDTVIAFTDPLDDLTPPSIRGGHVAFLGSATPKLEAPLRGAGVRAATAAAAGAAGGAGGGNFYYAVLHSNAISFTKLADTDTDLPGGGGAFTSLAALSFDELFGVFGGSGAGQSGIYLGCCGPAPAPLALVGDPIPGGGTTYALFFSAALDRDPGAGVNWVVVLAATSPAFEQGIYLLGPQPDVIADFGTTIPGTGEPFTGFSIPDIDEGVLAFRGHGVSGHAGIYARGVTDTNLVTVADTDTSIPGGNGTFTGFGASSSFGVLSTRNGDVAFRGDGAASQQGVYAWIDGALQLIADRNTQPPPPAEAPGPFFTFPDTAPSISDGNVAFVTANEIFQSYLYVRFNDELIRIVGAGDPLDGKTVNGAAIGPESLDGNLLAFKVFFTDGTAAIYVAILGQQPPPADINEDGEVGTGDVALVLDGWGPCDDCAECPADVDGDCQVGVVDLLFLLAAWGPLDAGPPVNDDCGAATTITAGAHLFSTVGATTSDVYIPTGGEVGYPSTAGVDCDEGAGYAIENDIWFRYVAPDRRGILTVMTCGIADFDTRLALYRRSPGTPFDCNLFEGIVCNDDAPFCAFGSLMSVWIGAPDNPGALEYSVEPGDELLIRVGSRDAAITGSGTLVVTIVPLPGEIPVGEEPGDCGAWAFLPGQKYVASVAVTKESTGTLDDTPSCGGLDVKDQWWCFTSPWTGVTEVWAGTGSDGGGRTVAVYDQYGTLLDCATGESGRATAHWGAVSGQVYLIRFGTQAGTTFVSLAYLKRLDDDACGWPFSGSCFLSNPGIPGCDQGSCCTLICGSDPYCCHVEWDGFCATQANILCDPNPGPACPGFAEHSCYEPSSDPSCNDATCCEAVCQIDAFCCDVEWDLECVATAAAVCNAPACGQLTEQSCCEPSLFPGCNDPACCGVVCEIIPACCTVDWNQQCADTAAAVCAACP